MKNKRALLTVFVAVLLDLVGFGILIPVQPFLAESLDASPAIITLVGATYSAMQFIFAPLWGRLSDRIGRRPVMISSIAFGVCGYLLLGFADSIPMLFAGRALAGFGNANLAVAQAVVSDVTTAENRAKGMGMLGAAFGLGFIIGPIIGGFASRWGLHAPALVAGALGALNWLLALAWLQETHPPEKRTQPAEVRRAPWDEAIRVPGVGRMLAIGFLLTTGFALFEQVLSLFVAEVWAKGGTEAIPGEMPMAVRLTVYFLMTIGLTGAIVQGGLIGRIGKRFAARSIAAVGMALMALGVLGIPLVQGLPFAALIGVGFVLALGSGLTNPTLMGMLSNLAPAHKRGSILGVGQAANSLGRVVGPAIAGSLFEYSSSLPFFIGAALVALCLVILLARPADGPEAVS